MSQGPRIVAAGGALVAALAAGAVVFAVAGNDTEGPATDPVSVAAPSPDSEASTWCPALLGELPDELAGGTARRVASDSPYVAAWGDPAVVLRCGVPRPADLTATSVLLTVNGVDWLQSPPQDGAVLWTAVGREVYVDVSVPEENSSQEDVLSPVSTAIADTLPEVS